MTTTTTTQSPVAYISIGKNRQKIYSNSKIFLRNGQDFSIELFNPTQETIGAKIFMNGKAISERMIVLKPGERDYLERFIEDNKKFVFETYEVENTQESRDAIARNGFIRVEFYKEYYPTTTSSTFYINNPQPYNPPYNPWFTGTGSPTILCRSTTDNSRGFASIDNAHDGMASCNYMSSDVAGEQGQPGIAGTNSLETGRVEAGAQSNQNFNTYNGTFLATSFATSEYQILPESMRPVELKQIRQYCHSCGNRIRKESWKFCPTCGSKFE